MLRKITYQEALAKMQLKQSKRKPLKRKSLADKINEGLDKLYSPRKSKTARKTILKKKTKKDYYKGFLAENSWIKSIPPGSHGSTPEQKKLWKLVTDYVRIRDFHCYGTCISCNGKFDTWKEAQGGHYISYTKCKGTLKFAYQNCFAQCAFCNSRMNDNKWVGGRIFAENIVKRHGYEWLELIETFSKGEPNKIELPQIIYMMKIVIDLTKDLPEQPDYYSKLD